MQPGGFPPPEGGREDVRIFEEDQRHIGSLLRRTLSGVREGRQADGDEVLQGREQVLRSPHADLLPHRPGSRYFREERQVCCEK